MCDKHQHVVSLTFCFHMHSGNVVIKDFFDLFIFFCVYSDVSDVSNILHSHCLIRKVFNLHRESIIATHEALKPSLL